MISCLLAGIACAALAAPIPVILDTDIGDDIDDTWALCLLLASPEFDVKLIVTASDNTPVKTRLTAKMLQQVDRTEIPIGTGKKTSDREIHQAKWLGDFSLKDYPGTIHEDGVQALINTLHAATEPMPLFVIGPQTNLGEALKRDPSIAGKARIYSMAGSVHIGYGGKEGRQPEWNVFRDVEAIRAAFAAPWPIAIAPLDICGTLTLKGGRYKRIAESASPYARVIMENYEAWTNFGQYPPGESSVLFDTAAIYLALPTEWMETESISLRIDDQGNTVPDPAGRPVTCALRWKDRDAFEEWMVQRLTE